MKRDERTRYSDQAALRITDERPTGQAAFYLVDEVLVAALNAERESIASWLETRNPALAQQLRDRWDELGL